MLTLIVRLNSNNLLIVWFLLELNIILFIPLHYKQNTNTLNNLIKYFILQRLAGLILLALILTQNFLILCKDKNLIIIMVLIIKLGIFPFSSWYFQVTENIEWHIWFLINTLQKIIPLWLISNYNNIIVINIMIILNRLYSSIEIWKQNSIRWILNSSSLNHVRWILIRLNTNTNNWEIYIIIYCWLSYNITKILKFNNTKTLIRNFNCSFTIKIILTITLLNFIRMPPITGFLPKLLIIKNINSITFLIPLLMNNIFLLFFYLTLIKNLFLKKIYSKKNKTPSFYIITNNGLSTSFIFYLIIIF